MRGSPNSKPSNGTIALLMVLVIGVVFEHAVSVPLSQIVAESLLAAVVVAVAILLLKYWGVSAA